MPGMGQALSRPVTPDNHETGQAASPLSRSSLPVKTLVTFLMAAAMSAGFAGPVKLDPAL